jgi:hypothetical protein
MLGSRKSSRKSRGTSGGGSSSARAGAAGATPAGGQRLSLKAWAAFGTVGLAAVTAIAATIGGNIGNRVVPPPVVPEPEPGGGFTAAVNVIPKCGQHYALTNTIDPQTQAADLHAVSTSDASAMQAFLRGHDGAPQSTITVEIVFTGTSRLPTRILDVKVDRLKTSANLNGTALRTRCEGDPPARPVEVDLDAPPRELTSQGKPYFDGKDLEVSVEVRENLRVFVTAKANSYRWIFAVRYLDGTGKVTKAYLGADERAYDRLDAVPEDAEFNLTGPARSYGVSYEASGGRFYLVTE